MHLLWGALEEASAAADEECVACEDGSLVGCGVFEEVADAVLGVAGSVQGFDRNGAELECGVVGGRFGYGGAVAAADYGEGIVSQLGRGLSFESLGVCIWVGCRGRAYSFCVAACVVVVTVHGIRNGFFLQNSFLRKGGWKVVLVGVHDVLEIDCAAVDLLLQYWEDSGMYISAKASLLQQHGGQFYSGGFAGSMIVASLLFSSTTRYA